MKHVVIGTNVLQKIPAAFGRLCVETFTVIGYSDDGVPSRLRAAVC